MSGECCSEPPGCIVFQLEALVSLSAVLVLTVLFMILSIAVLILFKNDPFCKSRFPLAVVIQTIGWGSNVVIVSLYSSQLEYFQDLIELSWEEWRFGMSLANALFISALFARMYRLHEIHKISLIQLQMHDKGVDVADAIQETRRRSSVKWGIQIMIKVFVVMTSFRLVFFISLKLLACRCPIKYTTNIVFLIAETFVQVCFLGWFSFKMKSVADSADQWKELVGLFLSSCLLRLNVVISDLSLDDVCSNGFAYNIVMYLSLAFVIFVGILSVISPLYSIQRYGNGIWFLKKGKEGQLLEFNHGAHVEGWELHDVIQSDWGLECLKKFLMREHSVENIMFWEDVREYKANPTEAKVQNIMETYLQINAPMELNTSESLIKEVIKNHAADGCIPALFDYIVKDVLSTLKRDSYVRFCKSEEAKIMVLHSENIGHNVRRQRLKTLSTKNSGK